MMTDVLGIASLIVAAVAAGAAAWQAHLLRFSLQVQSLLEMEKEFNTREFRRTRHHAARQLQANAPDPDVDDVLNFFATLALLVRRRALDAEMVWHAFFYWLHGYWQASHAYIDQERARNRRVWEDIPALYNRLVGIESRRGVQHQDDIANFLESEVEQYDAENPRS